MYTYATVDFWLLLTKPTTKDDEGQKKRLREKERGKRSEGKQRRAKDGDST
jgi:hypothetical protein